MPLLADCRQSRHNSDLQNSRDGCASHWLEFYRTQFGIKERGKTGLKQELEINYIFKGYRSKIVKRPSTCLVDRIAHTIGKALIFTCVFQNKNFKLLGKGLQALLTPRVRVKILCSLELNRRNKSRLSLGGGRNTCWSIRCLLQLWDWVGFLRRSCFQEPD